jgi:hypothetical protein
MKFGDPHLVLLLVPPDLLQDVEMEGDEVHEGQGL